MIEVLDYNNFQSWIKGWQGEHLRWTQHFKSANFLNDVLFGEKKLLAIKNNDSVHNA